MIDKEKERREKRNAYRRTEEYKAKRRATRDLAKDRERWATYAARPEVKEYLRQKAKEYQRRPEVKEHYKKLRRQEYLRKGKQRGLDAIKNLSDSYIKNGLISRTSLTYKDIPKEMVEAKRLELLIRREYLKNISEQERKKIYKKRSLARKRKLLTKENQDEKRN